MCQTTRTPQHMSRIFQFPLYHIFCEMQLGLQLSLYSYNDLLIRHFFPPTYPEYHSVTPHFKGIYFLAHRTIPSPSLTPIIQYREHVTVQYLHLCTKPDIASHQLLILPKSRFSHSNSCSNIFVASCILCYPAT